MKKVSPLGRPAHSRSVRTLRVERLEARQMLSISPSPWDGRLVQDANGAPTGPGTAAEDLGTVDFDRLELGKNTPSNAWFRFTPERDATLTAQLIPRALGLDIDLVLFEIDADGRLDEVAASEQLRLDHDATAGRQYYLLAEGVRARDTLVLANLVTHIGAQVAVHGTDGDDSFALKIGPTHAVTINGLRYDFDAAEVGSIAFDGQAGNDTARVDGSAADETIVLKPTSARLSSDGFEVKIENTPNITIDGGGGRDDASFYDSIRNDTFRTTPTDAELAGPGYLNRVENVTEVHAYAKLGGYDVAKFRGSTGSDRFVGRAQWSKLTGDGYSVRAKFFDSVLARSSGGNDSAFLYGTSGDDTFVADPARSSLSGAGYSLRTIYFTSVTARAFSGNGDNASFYDSAGNDVFHASPTEATLYGKGFTNRARGFGEVHAYAKRGGYDVAHLHDSPGNDTYVGRDNWGKLKGDGFRNRAKFFDAVHAYADNGGQDTAYLWGSAGPDAFVGTADYARLDTGRFLHRAGGFDTVSARGSSGRGDTARLYDTVGVDRFEADANRVTLSNAERPLIYRIAAIENVEIELSNPADVADIRSTSAIDVTVRRAGSGVELNAADYFDANSPSLGFQDAIDALPDEGGIVVIPEGTWTLRASLVLRSHVTLRGANSGATLQRADQAVARLTSAAAAGDRTIQVDSVDGFQVGDEIGLFANGNSEIAQPIIESIEPGRITFRKPLAVSGSFQPKRYAEVANYFALIRSPRSSLPGQVVDVTIENLSLDGNFDPEPILWRFKAPGLIQLENVSDAVIRNVAVRNTPATAIRLERGYDNRIENTLIEYAKGHGIFLDNETDTAVLGTTVRYAGYGYNGDGILLNGGLDIRVEDSLMEYNQGPGLHPGGDGDSLTRGGVWARNTSRYNLKNGFQFCWDNFDLTVTDNVIHDNGQYGVGGLDSAGSFGDRFNTITNNLIYNNARNGIRVNGTSDNVISGNQVRDNSRSKPGTYSGIYLKNATNTTVSNNVVLSDPIRPTHRYGIEEAGSSSNDNTIVDNILQGYTEDDLRLLGENTFASGNA